MTKPIVRRPLLTKALFGLFWMMVVLAATFVGYLIIWEAAGLKDRFTEARPSAYEDLAHVPKACPPLKSKVDTALADGTLSVHEARRIGDELRDLTNAYEHAKEMNKARSTLKLKPIKVPTACDNRSPIKYRYDRLLDPFTTG